MSKSEFAKFVFGKDDICPERIMCFYNDWKSSGYEIALFKQLLITRG